MRAATSGRTFDRFYFLVMFFIPFENPLNIAAEHFGVHFQSGQPIA